MKELRNKRVFLTGASSGIGYALAKKLVNEGSIVSVMARRIDRLRELAVELKGSQGKIYTYECDITNIERVSEITAEIVNISGGIDIAILNSGIGRPEGVDKFSSEYADEIFGTNVLGMIKCIEVLLPVFVKQKSGIIAGVSSLADNRGYSRSGFYCASKAAVTIMLESLRVELKRYGINVLTIKPGFVRSEMTARNKFKMPFLIDAEKAADIIIRGLKKEKRIIQFPLPTVIGAKIIGLLPAWLYEYFETGRGGKVTS
jgi:short-subunit dehydrogenase